MKFKNNRAQVNLEFIVAVVLLTFVIISTVIFTIRLFPALSTSFEESNLRAKAEILEDILLYRPGIPANWTQVPIAVIGLAQFNNYSNETILGSLDPTKLTYLNTSNFVNYSLLKTNLSLGNDIDFYLKISSNWGIMEYFNHTPGKTDRVISINKFMVINKTNETNVTLLVW